MTEYIASSDLTPSLSEDVLITILPVHAGRIYAGTKKFEFRKRIPRIVPRRVFLYETKRVQAVTGHIVLDGVVRGTPEHVWKFARHGGSTKQAFNRYFDRMDTAYAYRVAASVRYSNPIPLSQVLAIDAGFRVPQQFLYLQNVPKLHRHLRATAVRECLSLRRGNLRLREIDPSERAEFIRSVEEHISRGYSETGEEYARRLLSISERGHDPEGFLTTAKSVRVIELNKKMVGFVVLTFKIGGCVKTGPVILSQAHRSRGTGQRLREQIHEAVYHLGYRKVYATVPADNVPAYQYLLSSGYRIEAHLVRPYHPEHDELVLGYMLTHERGPGPEFVRQLTPTTTFRRISRLVPELSEFLEKEFASTYCTVPAGWANRQMRAACSAHGGQAKPRLVFAASNESLLALGICLLKRGGSAKLVLLSQTGHQQSLADFVGFIESETSAATRNPPRRFYTHVPAKDSDVMQAFLDRGYRPEGLIEQPYAPGADIVVLGKTLL
jgi:predicted transcriptional regulator